MASAFGERLRKAREKSGLTVYALGKLTGITPQAVGRLEQDDDRVPSWDTVQLLAKALGVDCRAFMDPDLDLPPRKEPGKPGRPRKDQAEKPPTKPAGEKARRKGP